MARQAALALALLLAGCAQLKNEGLGFHVGVSNVWTFDAAYFGRERDVPAPPPMIASEEDDDGDI